MKYNMKFQTSKLKLRVVMVLVFFFTLRYQMDLLTWPSHCCGPRRWRSQWMYSLSWRTPRWSKGSSRLLGPCSSTVVLSTYPTQSKSYLLTYKLRFVLGHHNLTTWSRVHLERLITTQLFKKLPAFYGTGRFITMLKHLHGPTKLTTYLTNWLTPWSRILLD